MLAPRKPLPIPAEQRATERRPVVVPGRVTWKDARGTTRMANVVTRDISEQGVFVEWQAASAIPLYRLVHFQVERPARDRDDLPMTLRNGKVLSAVYRIGPCQQSTGTPDGYALRLLVEPRRQTSFAEADENGSLRAVVGG